MYRVSMPDFDDALSRLKDKASDFKQYLSERKKSFVDWVEWRRRKNYLDNKYRGFVDRLKRYGEMYGTYVVYEFVPYVFAYGLIINFPAHVLLGFGFTWETVLSWGLAFYLVREELTSFLNEVKPYIRVSAKVDN